MTLPLILKTKMSQRILFLVIALFFVAGILWLTFFPPQTSPFLYVLYLLAFAGFLLSSVRTFLQSLTLITFDGEALISQRVFRNTVRIGISHISHLHHNYWDNTLILRSDSDNASLKIDQSVQGFVPFFEYLRMHRPEMWQVPPSNDFHVKGTFLAVVFAPLALLLFSFGALFLGNKLTFTLSIGALVAILLLLNIAKTQVIGLSFLPEGINLRFPFGRKHFVFSEISKVLLTVPGDNQAIHYVLTIDIGDKRTYSINGFEVHEVLLYDKFATLMPDKVARASEVANQTIDAK